MRAFWFTCLVAIASACSGEPFTTAPANALGGQSQGVGGSGGAQSTPGTPQPNAAGAQSTPRDDAGGKSSTAGTAAVVGGAGGASGAGDEAAGAPQGNEGGEGGATPAPACPSGPATDWELGYFPELREPTTQEVHPFFQVTSKAGSTSLDRISIRYYFTKESQVAETAMCFWVTGDHCQLAKLEFGEVPSPTTNATRYVQVTFPRASDVLVVPGTLEVRIGFKTGAAPLIQTNDYSFDASSTLPSAANPYPYKRWSLATLYVDGKLVSGTEPCSLVRSPGDTTHAQLD